MTRPVAALGWLFALAVAVPLVAPERSAIGGPGVTAALAGAFCALAAILAAAGCAGWHGRHLLAATLPAGAAAAWLSPQGADAALPVGLALGAAALFVGASRRLRERRGEAAARALALAAWAALVVPLLWAGASEVAGFGTTATADGWRRWTPLQTAVPSPLAALPLAALAAAAALFAHGRAALLPASAGLALLVAIGAGPAQAPEPAARPQVLVTPLLGACYRPGRFLPLRLVVTAGAAALRGTVRLVPDGGWPVEVPVDVPPSGLLRADVRVLGHGSALRVRVEVPPGLATPAPLEWSAPPTAVPLGAFVRGPGDGPAPVADAATRVGGPLADLDEADLPGTPEALDGLDLVVLGRLDGTRVPPGAARALVAWVAAGGRLVLSDPDVLRRLPALDDALFAMVPPEEGPGVALPGLPPAHRQALRRRGIRPADCHAAAPGVPAFATFDCGRGRGLLVLPDDDAAPAADVWALAPAAWDALRAALGTSHPRETPALAPARVGAVPAPAPGGPARLGLAALLVLCAWLGPLGARLRTAAAAAAVGVATLAAAALGAECTGPVAVVGAIVRPADGRAPLGARTLALEWLVQAAAPRAARTVVALAPGDEVRPLLRRLAEADALAGIRRHGPHPELADLHPAPGHPSTLAVTRLARGHGVVAVRTGPLVIVSNRTGQALPMLVHAHEGRFRLIGPLGPGATASRGLAAAGQGPLAVLAEVAGSAGTEVGLALQLAFAREGDGDEAIYAVLPEAPGGPPPAVAGARVRVLPAVLVVPVETR